MCGGVVAYVDGREGGPCEVQVGMRGLQVSEARLMVAFMGCIVECFSQREGVAGRGWGILTRVSSMVGRFRLQVLCMGWVCSQYSGFC